MMFGSNITWRYAHERNEKYNKWNTPLTTFLLTLLLLTTSFWGKINDPFRLDNAFGTWVFVWIF